MLTRKPTRGGIVTAKMIHCQLRPVIRISYKLRSATSVLRDAGTGALTRPGQRLPRHFLAKFEV